MSLSGVLVCLFLLLSAPYDAAISALKPACSPIFIFLALGVQIGLATALFVEARGHAVKGWKTPLSGILLAGSLIAVSLDWMILLQFDLASADAGWFGTTEFVFFRAWFNEYVRPLCTFSAAVAGGMLLFDSCESKGSQCDSHATTFSLSTTVRLCVQLCILLALGFSSRGMVALFYDLFPYPPLAATASAVYSGVLFALLALSVRRLNALECGANPIAPIALLFTAGVVAWEASIRVVPVLECSLVSVPLVLLATAFSIAAAVADLRKRGAPSRVEHVALKGNGDHGEHDGASSLLEGYDLSDRERSIATLVMEGNTTSAAAACLGISASTVRVTLRRVYKKLGIGGMPDLRAMSPMASTAEMVDSAEAQESEEAPMSAPPGLSPLLFVAFVVCICMFPYVARIYAAPQWGLFRGELYVLGIAAYLLGVVWLCLQIIQDGDRPSWSRYVSPRLLIACIGVACLLAASGEEMRRGVSGFGLIDIFSPFEFTLILGSFLVIGTLGKRSSRGVVVFAVIALAVCALWIRGCLHALSLMAVVYALCLMVKDRSALRGLLAIMVTVHGLFLFGSDYLVNRIFDIFLTGGYLTEPFGGRLPFALLVIGVICIAMTVVALCFILECFDHVQEYKYRTSLGSIELYADRVRHLFLGKGLSSSQADVLILIVQGRGSAQIAVELCMSKGTVNTARRVGYKKLGVHSKVELMSYLNREMGR